ncbi:MAG: hypothetical protein A2W93_03965 [Bacteroidetes bacterium GWF2_43_63]|nr:MAG: hypothetical protein A2W94_06250 [Bacteroidetes bacterium GWE2_42_42]OFY54338.1 MAG: hypothetical protein A2W93_03965 [Bacteroidetes bacterium GWF2_43_63]HBG69273.1 hypothetical protein [Bacteroidales bacterium]HCB61171.1 hypothetical protein [Bacteroidales bacterium]HCY24091.1 hypothetical protein [Bacteroidales bacterium]
MKHFASVMAMAFIAFVLFSCGGKESKTNDSTDSTKTEEQVAGNPDQIYGVEKGMIEYKMVTMGMPTTMTMYWDNFGKKSYTESAMEMMGVTTTSFMLNDGEYVYSWDGTTKQGTKVKAVKSDNLNYNDVSTEMMDKYHMTKEAGQEIQGKMCDVYKMEFEGTKSKTWVWKGIAIKSETTAMGMTITTEMTKLEEGASAPEGAFEAPKGVTFKEATAPAK